MNPYDVIEYGYKFDLVTETDRLYAWTDCIGIACNLEGESQATVAAQSAASWNAWESLFCRDCGRMLNQYEAAKGYASEGYCVDCWYNIEESAKGKKQRILSMLFC